LAIQPGCSNYPTNSKQALRLLNEKDERKHTERCTRKREVHISPQETNCLTFVMNEQTITGRWNFDRSKSKREKSGRSTPLVKGKEEDQKKK
jgi:hypothetical protein